MKNLQNIFKLTDEKIYRTIKYNFAFRSGINESDIIGSGQFPFYIVSAYADKRLNHKSAIQLGADVFFSNFLEELIYYQSHFQKSNISEMKIINVLVFL